MRRFPGRSSRVVGGVLFLLTIFIPSGLAQTGLTIDRLDRKGLGAQAKESGFSTLVEGTVANPELALYVMVRQPQLKAWRLFPAAVETEPETKGRYRWRALCLLGELDGRGIGDQYQVRAVALEPSEAARGPLTRIPVKALRSETLVIKRVR